MAANLATLLKAYQDAVAAAKKRKVDPQKDPAVAAARKAYQAAKSGKPAAKPAGGQDLIDRDVLRKKYGWLLQVIDSNAELKALFTKATGKTPMTDAAIEAELRSTNWYKTHGESFRKAEILRLTDGTTWEQNVTAALDKLRTIAGKYGVQYSEAELKAMAENSLRYGWTEEQYFKHVAEGIDTVSEASVADKLRGLARANGLPLADSFFINAAKQLAAGTLSEDVLEAQIREQAASRYAAWGDQIRAGMNVNDLASAYVQSAQNILEDSSIDVMAPEVQRALMAVGQDGKPRVQSLWDYEQTLRQDPRWRNTSNGRKTTGGLARQLAEAFGMVTSA